MNKWYFIHEDLYMEHMNVERERERERERESERERIGTILFR